MSKSTITVGGIKADLTIDGDNQRFVYNNTSPNNSLEIRSSFVPITNIPVTMRQSSININLSGYEWVQKTQAGENAGTYTLRQTLNAGADTTDIMRINENKTVTFLVPTNIDPSDVGNITLEGAISGSGLADGTPIITSLDSDAFKTELGKNDISTLQIIKNVDFKSFRIINIEDANDPMQAVNRRTAQAMIEDRTTNITGAVMGSAQGNNPINTNFSPEAFMAELKFNGLDKLGTPTGNYNMGGYKIGNAANATDNTDLVPLGQVNSLIAANSGGGIVTITGAVSGSGDTSSPIETKFNSATFSSQLGTHSSSRLLPPDSDVDVNNKRLMNIPNPANTPVTTDAINYGTAAGLVANRKNYISGAVVGDSVGDLSASVVFSYTAFAAQLALYSISTLTMPTSAFSFNNQTVTGLPNAVAATSPVPLSQVNTIITTALTKYNASWSCKNTPTVTNIATANTYVAVNITRTTFTNNSINAGTGTRLTIPAAITTNRTFTISGQVVVKASVAGMVKFVYRKNGSDFSSCPECKYVLGTDTYITIPLGSFITAVGNDIIELYVTHSITADITISDMYQYIEITN